MWQADGAASVHAATCSLASQAVSACRARLAVWQGKLRADMEPAGLLSDRQAGGKVHLAYHAALDHGLDIEGAQLPVILARCGAGLL